MVSLTQDMNLLIMLSNNSFIGTLLSIPLFLVSLIAAGPLAIRQSSQSQSTSIYPTRFGNVTWNNNLWQLSTTNLDQGHYQSRISLANGYIGINLAALGPFFEYDQPVDGDVLNGWPLFDRRQTFATIGGFWDVQPDFNGTNFPWLSQYGWDSAISGIPHWSAISLDLGNSTALYAGTDPSQIHNFTSSIDMRHAVMNWAFTWSPSSQASFDISYQMFLHKVNVTQAFISMNITSKSNIPVNIVNILDGDCAMRTTFNSKGSDGGFICSSVHPSGLNDISAFVYANMSIVGATITNRTDTYNASYIGKNASSIASAVTVNLTAGTMLSVIKYIGIASTDAFPNAQNVARNSAMSAQNSGYSAALQSHVAEWTSLFPPTSVDNYSSPTNGSLPNDSYIVEAQIMAVVNPFYLLQNTVSESAVNTYPNAPINNHSIAVGGLGSDSYAGQIFWDAAVWMQPGLVAAFPYAAKGDSNYRVSRYAQAQQNVKTSYQSSKNTTTFSSGGAIFPWTSGRYGNCTATGPCWDYEYHINGDIGLAFINYWLATGDTDYFQKELLPIHESVSLTFSELLTANGSNWSLTNMTDPDEFANMVDNGAFTMALIAETLDNANSFAAYYNQSTNQTWTSQAEKVLISRNSEADILLEYTGMNGTVDVKQADVVLVTYPLSYNGQNYSASDSVSDLDYYASKQSEDGPGMTYSVFSIVANEVSTTGCSAYTYQQYSTQPYVRAPWFQFSEQLLDNFNDNGGFHPAFPFLTGHGGANQVVLFGYLGFRFIPDWNLHIDPNLPPQIPYIRYRKFYWHGWPISASSNQTHTTLSRSTLLPSTPGVVPNTTFSNSAIPVIVGPVNGNSTTTKTYSLPPNGTLIVPNRQVGLTQTFPGNIAQCQPATTDSEIVPGQFAISAIDGALSTKWQPALANKTAHLTVQLTPGLQVLGFVFQWSQAPPYNYSIYFHNDFLSSSNSNILTVLGSAKASISSPLVAADAALIKTPGANSSANWLNGTNTFSDGMITLRNLVTSKYATLAVWGSLYNGSLTVGNMSGPGAQVAEWNIVTMNTAAMGMM